MSKNISCNNSIHKQEYKVEDVCAGTKCTNKPPSVLKVKYINKTGSFCKQHAKDLLQLELAEEISKEGLSNA